VAAIGADFQDENEALQHFAKRYGAGVLAAAKNGSMAYFTAAPPQRVPYVPDRFTVKRGRKKAASVEVFWASGWRPTKASGWEMIGENHG